MKAEGIHEGCIEQLHRLFVECLYSSSARLDDAGRYRVDDRELEPVIQQQVEAIWPEVTEENLLELTDFEGYNKEFLKLFGFGLDNIDYDVDISPMVKAEF